MFVTSSPELLIFPTYVVHIAYGIMFTHSDMLPCVGARKYYGINALFRIFNRVYSGVPQQSVSAPSRYRRQVYLGDPREWSTERNMFLVKSVARESMCCERWALNSEQEVASKDNVCKYEEGGFEYVLLLDAVSCIRRNFFSASFAADGTRESFQAPFLPHEQEEEAIPVVTKEVGVWDETMNDSSRKVQSFGLQTRQFLSRFVQSSRVEVVPGPHSISKTS